jgi:glyoxylase-like metal-dependent hydrolase (beta-lactamase superfamily II)
MAQDVEEIAPGIRMVRAANPSQLTGSGTNSYLIGTGAVALIDPGPSLSSHRDALLGALSPGERISHILVTHPHKDHSALAPEMATITGAKIYAFGTVTEGRSLATTRTSLTVEDGGEGLDMTFTPDHRLGDGAEIAGDDWSLRAIHTPGHLGGHLCFALGEVLFSGDHMMGWSSTVISPPDGDMAAYMASLRRLQQEPWTIALPGHGDPIRNPAARLTELITHREARDAQIRAALAGGAMGLQALTLAVYHDIPPSLLPVAERNTLAHLIDLEERKLVGHEASTASAPVFRIL